MNPDASRNSAGTTKAKPNNNMDIKQTMETLFNEIPKPEYSGQRTADSVIFQEYLEKGLRILEEANEVYTRLIDTELERFQVQHGLSIVQRTDPRVTQLVERIIQEQTEEEKCQ